MTQPVLFQLSPLRIAGIYLVISSLWIAFSDQALIALLPESTSPEGMTLAQTLKGWFFILVSAGVLWAFIQRLSDHQSEIIGALRFSTRIIDNTHNGVMMTNGDGDIVYVNNAMTTITGYSKEELLGENPSILSSGHHDHSFYDAMWKELENQGVWQGEIINRRRNGKLFTEWITISKLVDEETGQIRYVSVISDISKSKKDRERLQYLAFYDPLTELPNRSLAEEHLKKALQQSALEGDSVAILFVDLDDFRIINETLGHNTGDQVLREAAERFSECAPDSFIGRFSGDQFLLIRPAIHKPDEVARLAERLLDCLDPTFELDGNHALSIRATIGITLRTGQQEVSPEDINAILSEADAALNEAKSRSKHGFAFFRQDMTERAQKRLDLEQALNHAIHNGELCLHYQPVLDASGTHLVGAEALVRWQHPEQGMIPPGDFIPVAEDTGLIGPLGHWVMQETLRQTREWLDRGFAPGLVAFNVSARQIDDEYFPAQLEAALTASGVSPRHIELELTESSLMTMGAGTIERLNQLRATGVQLAVDDFGTGYSSLAYLRRFPLNKLKIDRSFVSDLEPGLENESIIRAIIAMTHALGLIVQGEGVETESQRQLLASLGCDCWQGYLASAPLDPERFEARYLR